MPEAAPARSGGAADMMRSLVSVNTGAMPIDCSTIPATTRPGPSTRPACVISRKPSAATASPPAMTSAGRSARADAARPSSRR